MSIPSPGYRRAAFGLFALALGLLGAASISAQTPYRVIDQWKIGGTGGWDYLHDDSAAHLLYVTHGPRVEVIDTTTGKVVGAITGMNGTHGIALPVDGKYGYISDGGSNAVVVFDRHDFHTVTTIPAGTNPDGIVFEPVTKTVWAFNGRSQNATVIDAATTKVVATIALPGKPEFPVADGKGNVYDNIESANSIVRLDAHSKTVTATWKLQDCESPSGLAIDQQHMRLFAVCDGQKMAVVDATSGKQIASPSIGEGPDAARFSERNQFAFSSNGGSGTLSVVDAAHGFATVETLPTLRGARTMAYDPETDRIFLSTAQFGPAPAATPEHPRTRPAVLPNSFTILVVGRK
jgi:DNA-binding beta-propeller fold protein YncE